MKSALKRVVSRVILCENKHGSTLLRNLLLRIPNPLQILQDTSRRCRGYNYHSQLLK